MIDKMNLRILKRNFLNTKMEEEKDRGSYKYLQLMSKIEMFNRKNFPNILWDSSTKGTYRKGENA